MRAILDEPFRHSTFFKGAKMTKKEFLDYVLAHVGDWWLKGKVDYDAIDCLTEIPPYKYFYLQCAGSKARYRLSDEECDYLGRRNKYFFDSLQEGEFDIANPPVWSAAGTPIPDNISLVEFSR